MENSEIITYAENTVKDLSEIDDIVPFIKLTKDEKLIGQAKSLNSLRVIILESLQMGNYKRALIFSKVMSTIISHVKEEKSEITDQLTELIIKL